MYFVDRSKIEQILQYIDVLIKEFENVSLQSPLEKLSLERLAQMLIEATLDVGNMMIDGFIMRDPGSYEDIIDILIDEKVLLADDERGFKEVIRLRTTLVRDYVEIDHDLIFQILKKNRHLLSRYSVQVRSYLDNELGVAHAFSNE